MRATLKPRTQFLLALGGATAVTLVLFAGRALRNGTSDYSYLVWNLFLAWLPLLFALWLTRVLKIKLWSSWEALAASLLWLLFLPNSFYMISDFIHLQNISTVDILYDTVMFTSFVYVSLILGFSSLYLVHLQLKKRFSLPETAGWIGLVLLLSSFAIYLGRDLRWNSWDVLTNPAGLLFDVSDRLIHPGSYGQIAVTVFSFFGLLASMYVILWFGTRLVRKTPQI
ncbi:MAG TPA: DUF1361 domain-containing protein [Candidatus Saccharimonadales bacterium]|nr:DUF1361 domain-containing protein [Candidatus Saccharimonadales bacterium]